MHSDRNGEGGEGPVEQLLTWDDEDVAAPERFKSSATRPRLLRKL